MRKNINKKGQVTSAEYYKMEPRSLPIHSRLTHDQEKIWSNTIIVPSSRNLLLSFLLRGWNRGEPYRVRLPGWSTPANRSWHPPPSDPFHQVRRLGICALPCCCPKRMPVLFQNSWETLELFHYSRFRNFEREPMFFVNRREAGFWQLRNRRAVDSA
jgi:hypothetical protein